MQTHTRNVCLNDYIHFSAQSNDDLDLGYELLRAGISFDHQ